MKLESLVIAGQLHCGEYVLESCTHRPSRQGSREELKSHFWAQARLGDKDEVVTRHG